MLFLALWRRKMENFNNAIMYFLSFKSYVVLPVIIFILAMIFRIKLTVAIKSALTIGIGFIGIFMTFDYFIKIINPVVQALIKRSGLHLNVLDGGWPPLAAIAWSFKLAPLLIVIFMVINIGMLLLRKTKTVDIDIWNYWHVILASYMVYTITNSAVLAIISAIISFIIVLKLAEWTAPRANKLAGMDGICFPHLEGITYFPIALLADKLMDKIPGLNKIDANPEKIQQKIGLLGEPMILGFILGLALGIGGGYDVKQISELAVGFAAVIYILPKMCGILGSSLIPISEGMKQFITSHFPDMGETYIGLDIVVVFGNPSVVVTALLLIPVALILAFILPGINFIPLGDLTSLMVPVGFICIATKGNVVCSFIIGVPMIIGNLYIASNMTSFFAKMAASANYQITGYSGSFTSFLSGGNFYRTWLIKAFNGELIGLIFIPVVIGLLYFAWKTSKEVV
jgi:galactitol PTS system EIIC component